MTDRLDDATIIAARIEASAKQAMMNAEMHGGDVATASADLLCAFVLLSVKSGADPDRCMDLMWDHAKACVADFWPEEPQR